MMQHKQENPTFRRFHELKNFAVFYFLQTLYMTTYDQALVSYQVSEWLVCNLMRYDHLCPLRYWCFPGVPLPYRPMCNSTSTDSEVFKLCMLEVLTVLGSAAKEQCSIPSSSSVVTPQTCHFVAIAGQSRTKMFMPITPST